MLSLVMTFFLFLMSFFSSTYCSLLEVPDIPPCEIVFPKLGDQLPKKLPTYSVLMCHFSDQIEMKLDEVDRQFSVVIKVLMLDSNTLQYNNVMTFPPVKSYALNFPAESEQATTISEFTFLSKHFNINAQYKFVYQIFVDSQFVDQVSTVVTYRDDDYFHNLLGLEKINLVDVDNLCDDIEPGGSCPFKSDVLKEMFTEKIDFIEVGTSAFDTCIENAEDHHRGISVEPLAIYQEMLPSPLGVIKENAAMDAKIINPDVDFGLMYYLDPHDLNALGYTLDSYSYMFGISSFGSIQNNLLVAHRLERKYMGTPSIFFQRSRVVPLLSMEELYVKHAVREVGLIKLDCEGLDLSIVHSIIPMLQKYELPYPCVLLFEVFVNTENFYETVQMLEQVGYEVISLSHSKDAATGGDFHAIHTECSASRVDNTSNFLSPHFGEALRMCNSRKVEDEYCCITMQGEDANQLKLCHEDDPFYIEI